MNKEMFVIISTDNDFKLYVYASLKPAYNGMGNNPRLYEAVFYDQLDIWYFDSNGHYYIEDSEGNLINYSGFGYAINRHIKKLKDMDYDCMVIKYEDFLKLKESKQNVENYMLMKDIIE